MSTRTSNRKKTLQDQQASHFPQQRQFGTQTPFHVRVFAATGNHYSLGIAIDPHTPISLDDYLKEELANGYVTQSVTGIVGDHSNVRVVTKHDQETAAKHPAIIKGLHPWHYRIFQENNQEYWHPINIPSENPGTPETLDHYLSTQAAANYFLKSLVGLDEPNATGAQPEGAKLRVATEYSDKENPNTEKKRRPYT